MELDKTTSPIENLCEDVFLEIISRLVANTGTVTSPQQYPPWVLRQVCSRWRGLCNRHNWLWNDIRISVVNPPNLTDVTSTICSMAALAGNIPLKLRFYHSAGSSGYVHKPNDMLIRNLIEWLGKWPRRDRVVLLEFQLRFIFKVIPALVEQPSFSALQTLLLKGRHGWSSGVDVDQNITRLIQKCPKLKTVSYRKVSLNVMGTGLASPPKIWPQLRSVDLGYFVDVEQWLDMLKAGDGLEEAFVYMMRSKGLDSRYKLKPHTHHLLKNLAIVFTARDTDCFQPFRLSHLPNLQRLQLFLFEKPQFTNPHALISVLPSMTELTVHRLWHLDLDIFIDVLRSNPQLEILHLSLSIRFCSGLFDFLTIPHASDELSSSSLDLHNNHTAVPALPRLRRLTLELAKVAVPASMHNNDANGGQITYTGTTHRSLSRMIDSRSGCIDRDNIGRGVHASRSVFAPYELVGSHRASAGSAKLEQATIRYISSCPAHNVKQWKKAAVFAGMMADEWNGKEMRRGGQWTIVRVEVADNFGYMDSFQLGGSHWGAGRD